MLRALVPANLVSAEGRLRHPAFQQWHLATFFTRQNLKELIEKHQEKRQISNVVSEAVFFSSGAHPAHTGGGKETMLKWHIII